MDELAVFPLPVVVFPGMTVPLHVYEERYKRLVRHATRQDPPRFLIAPPPGPALDEEDAGRPGAVGTRIDLLDASENPDGTFSLLGHGRERYRLRQVREERVEEHDGGERPLWYAEAEPWPLERDDPNEERVAAWDALDAFRRFGEAFFSPDARRQAEEALPDAPLYQASFVCANLRLEPAEAQRLLEAPSLIDRFRAAKAAIEERLAAREAGEGPTIKFEEGEGGLAAELGDDLDDAFAEGLEAELAALFGGDPDDDGNGGRGGSGSA